MTYLPHAESSSVQRLIGRVSLHSQSARLPLSKIKFLIRGACIVSMLKTASFAYTPPDRPTKRWSRVIYIGSGWIDDRLCAHLKHKKNDLLAAYLGEYELAYRFDRIVHSDILDWSKTVEASLLHIFENEFGGIPRANRRRETVPEFQIDRFEVHQSPNFDFLARG